MVSAAMMCGERVCRLIIRRRQLDVLAQRKTKDFQRRMSIYLRGQFPDQCGGMPEASLQARIAADIAKARSYRLRTERELTMYLTLSMGLGPALHQDKDLRWARKLLYDESMDGTVRMGLIFKMLAEQDAAREVAKS